jgi:hypothetical protein
MLKQGGVDKNLNSEMTSRSSKVKFRALERVKDLKLSPVKPSLTNIIEEKYLPPVLSENILERILDGQVEDYLPPTTTSTTMTTTTTMITSTTTSTTITTSSQGVISAESQLASPVLPRKVLKTKVTSQLAYELPGTFVPTVRIDLTMKQESKTPQITPQTKAVPPIMKARNVKTTHRQNYGFERHSLPELSESPDNLRFDISFTATSPQQRQASPISTRAVKDDDDDWHSMRSNLKQKSAKLLFSEIGACSDSNLISKTFASTNSNSCSRNLLLLMSRTTTWIQTSRSDVDKVMNIITSLQLQLSDLSCDRDHIFFSILHVQFFIFQIFQFACMLNVRSDMGMMCV